VARTLGAKDKQRRKRKLLQGALVGAGISAGGGYLYQKNLIRASLDKSLNPNNPYAKQFAKQLSTEFAVAATGLGLGLSALSMGALALKLRNSKNLEDKKYRKSLQQLNMAAGLSGALGGAGAALGASSVLSRKIGGGIPNNSLALAGTLAPKQAIALIGGGLVGGVTTYKAFKSRFGYNKKKGY
jgi:hypothetical protein